MRLATKKSDQSGKTLFTSAMSRARKASKSLSVMSKLDGSMATTVHLRGGKASKVPSGDSRQPSLIPVFPGTFEQFEQFLLEHDLVPIT